MLPYDKVLHTRLYQALPVSCVSKPARLIPTEVCMAIDQADYRIRLSPVHHIDGCRIDEKVEHSRKRSAKGHTQQRLDWTHMRNQHNRLPMMRLQERADSSLNALAHSSITLSFRRCHRQVALPGREVLSLMRGACEQICAVESFPQAKIAFAQLIFHPYLLMVRQSKRRSRLQVACQYSETRGSPQFQHDE